MGTVVEFTSARLGVVAISDLASSINDSFVGQFPCGCWVCGEVVSVTETLDGFRAELIEEEGDFRIDLVVDESTSLIDIPDASTVRPGSVVRACGIPTLARSGRVGLAVDRLVVTQGASARMAESLRLVDQARATGPDAPLSPLLCARAVLVGSGSTSVDLVVDHLDDAGLAIECVDDVECLATLNAGEADLAIVVGDAELVGPKVTRSVIACRVPVALVTKIAHIPVERRAWGCFDSFEGLVFAVTRVNSTAGTALADAACRVDQGASRVIDNARVSLDGFDRVLATSAGLLASLPTAPGRPASSAFRWRRR